MKQPKTPKYSPETRERAVRMVLEHRSEYASPWAAVESIAPKIGCSPHTLISTGTRMGSSRSAKSCRSPRRAIGAMPRGYAIPPCAVSAPNAMRD